MNFNLDYKIVERSDTSEKEIYDKIKQFIVDNSDLDGIYKLQSEEILNYLRRKLSVVEDEKVIEDSIEQL